METLKIKTSEILQMQHTIQSLENQLLSIRNIFFRYVSSENEDLRIIVKQILQDTSENYTYTKFIPEISEGDKDISPVLLSGKWSNLDIDAKQLRRQSWKEF